MRNWATDVWQTNFFLTPHPGSICLFNYPADADTTAITWGHESDLFAKKGFTQLILTKAERSKIGMDFPFKVSDTLELY